ncbi:MAG: monofunctional biosynthetic peptidoglycan transglycosylase [Bacteroidetes bacterium]|nr:MAG: monofunctional biosynthetic peptidoglycan transglycosylase [Bacteroidota bacterium]
MKEKLKKVGGWCWRFFKKATLWFLGLSIGSVILFRWVPIPATPLMFLRCIEQKFDGKEMHLEKDWVPFEEISPNLQLAVVCTEDQHFPTHNGFDFEAIQTALDDCEEGGRCRGASTISQQTAKNVFLWPGGSWFRKGFEVYFTFLIELFWSKERIMEVYLNVIEFGDGVYGAEAAAQKYFHKSAKDLSREEAALMAVVLPNPLKRSIGRPTKYLIGRRDWCLQQMRLWGWTLNYHPEEKKEKKTKKRSK